MENANSLFNDWSAIAAWIALIVSIVGTIAGPLITSLINNRFQLKLHKLAHAESCYDSYQQERTAAFSAFISNVGRCLANPSLKEMSDFGASYFVIYQYVPSEKWQQLDDLYQAVVSCDRSKADQIYADVIHMIAELSKVEPPKSPRK